MKGRLDLETLKQGIADGEIDTILVCMVDMQGRLIGKRVTGHFFLDHVIHEMHVCDYLLAVDMEMEPVPGYKAASWDLGYGDFAIRPDLGTLRRIPWLPGTALVLGDAVDHHGNDLPHAPRSILKRQLERARAMGYVAKMGSELEFYVFDETFESAREKEYRHLKTAGWYSEDYHIFQTTKEEPLIRAIRNGMDRNAALRAMTIVPARVLGIDAEFGTLEAGKVANIQILTGDPLEATSWVESVLLEGELVYERSKDHRLEHLFGTNKD